MITASFSLTATERVLPKLALDFTTASLDSRVTFTRTTDATHPATYVNNTGVLTAATNNQPRFDYDPVALTCKGLLIEESRSNLTTYSSAFNDTSWIKSGCSIDPDKITAPDGTATADYLIGANGTGNRYCASPNVVGTNVTYTISVYAKAGAYNQFRLNLTNFATESKGALFNVQTGTIVSIESPGTDFTNISATITPFNNGWYRCTVTATKGSVVTGTRLAIDSRDNSGNPTGDGVSGIYIWGAQFEIGAFATSYIPTTSASLTRNADVAVMTGTNFSNWYNQTQGAFKIQYSQYVTGGTLLIASDGTSSNYINIFTGGANQKASCNVFVAGVNNGRLDNGGTFVANSSNIAVYSLIANDRALSCNGNILSTSSSPTSMPIVDRLYIGSIYDGASGYANGHIKNISYYKQHITNAETQAFSK